MLNQKNIQSIHCTLYVLAMTELLNPAITDNLNKTRIQQFTEYKNVLYRSFRFHRGIFINNVSSDGDGRRSRGARNQRPCSIMLEPDKLFPWPADYSLEQILLSFSIL